MRYKLQPVLSCALTAFVLACSADDPLATSADVEPEALASSTHVTASGLQVGVSSLQVERNSGSRSYVVEHGLEDGGRAYIDRTYVYQAVPDLVRGMTYIQTAQSEQESNGNDRLLTFRLDREAVVYVAYNGDDPPAWVAQRGFAATGDTLVIAKENERSVHRLYARTYPSGEVVLGSNRSVPGSMEPEMYTVILRPNSVGRVEFASVAAGFYHSCGLTPEGIAYCWGEGSDGRLGDGSEHRRTVPVAVVGGHTFRSVSAGAYHSCGVADDGSAYCWGRNEYGQLGDGTTDSAGEPVLVAGGISFIDVSAGGSFTCGLSTTGTAYCWGRNNRGQLGTGASLRTVATQPMPLTAERAFASISTSWEHACGVLTGGAAVCWGKNDFGQLGTANTRQASRPRRVVGGITFASVNAAGVGTGPGGAGQNHTCGLATSGQAYCWGDNWHNPLGQDNTRGVRPRPQRVRGVPAFTQVVVGGDHSCGVTEAGDAWCWGDNSRGQLGAAAETSYSSARQVTGGHSFANLSLGWDHSCGVTTAGESYCWGWNERGQLGDGSTESSLRPVAIAPG